MAHPQHDNVRALYDYRCGYCSVSEVEAGGELTVDHFIPVSAGGDDTDDNLVYCCSRCNLYKADLVPVTAERPPSARLLHPLRDKVELHVSFDEHSGLLVPLTDTGRFHIVWLHLNRPPLVQYRLQQVLTQKNEARLKMLEIENARLRTIITLREEQDESLRRVKEEGTET